MQSSVPTPAIARRILLAFVVTFIASRLLVIAIMARWVPDFFLHMGGTHVHHLNYGIFLLSGVGAWLLLRPPGPEKMRAVAMIYGAGLALTFDEFGMWLHLGGSYWQRASYDAVVTIAAVFGLIVVMPSIRRLRARGWVAFAGVSVLVLVFGVMLVKSLDYAGMRLSPFLQRIENTGPR